VSGFDWNEKRKMIEENGFVHVGIVSCNMIQASKQYTWCMGRGPKKTPRVDNIMRRWHSNDRTCRCNCM